MPIDKEVFQNVELKTKALPKPHPQRVKDIDTNNTLYSNIMELQDSNLLDLNSISAFTNVSQSRDQVYNMLDVMSEDPMISAALNIYASDACEPNDDGHIVWAESDNELAAGMANHLLDILNVDKNVFDWTHSLVKYGDLYLRLYHNSEYEDLLFKNKTLNEDVILKTYKPDDHFAEYIEMHNNPAEIFDLQKFGKTIGYIGSHVLQLNVTNDTLSAIIKNSQTYNFDRGDVDLYPATDFVHACLKDNSNRLTEEVNISTDDDNSITYKVKRGQSMLYNIFRVWRELSLLENSVLLNRLTKSSIVRTVSVEVGDMEKNDVRNLMQRIKSMIEQKAAISIGNSYEDFTNPGPVENIIYVPTHDGKGAITTADIGGQVEPGQLTDLSYFKNKLNAGLGIPGAYLGEADSDGSLFNNGNSLSLKSSMYAKTVKRILNCICQAITDAINIFLLDKGLNEYVNQFSIKMQAPTTQEEKDRKDNITNTISNIREIMSLVDSIEDQATKLNILKQLLPQVTTNTEVIQLIQGEIDRLEEGATTEEEVSEDEFGAEPMVEEPMGEPAPMGAEEPEGELNDSLPTWDDLGVSYNEVKA